MVYGWMEENDGGGLERNGKRVTVSKCIYLVNHSDPPRAVHKNDDQVCYTITKVKIEM